MVLYCVMAASNCEDDFYKVFATVTYSTATSRWRGISRIFRISYCRQIFYICCHGHACIRWKAVRRWWCFYKIGRQQGGQRAVAAGWQQVWLNNVYSKCLWMAAIQITTRMLARGGRGYIKSGPLRFWAHITILSIYKTVHFSTQK